MAVDQNGRDCSEPDAGPPASGEVWTDGGAAAVKPLPTKVTKPTAKKGKAK